MKSYREHISDIIDEYLKSKTMEEIHDAIIKAKEETRWNPYDFKCFYVTYLDFMMGECTIDRIRKILEGTAKDSDIEDYKVGLDKADWLLSIDYYSKNGPLSENKDERSKQVDQILNELTLDMVKLAEEFEPYNILLTALIETKKERIENENAKV
jgi:hypothetical protein